MTDGLQQKAPRGRALAFVVACLAGLAACMHETPVALNGRTATITVPDAGHGDTATVHQEALIKAAMVTLDHGFRYFRISAAPPANPATARQATKFRVTVYRSAEINPLAPGVMDSDKIAAGAFPRAE